MRRGFLSTLIPLRAMSYRRFPFTLMAEYMGGICSISPVKEAAVSRIFLQITLPSSGSASKPSAERSCCASTPAGAADPAGSRSFDFNISRTFSSGIRASICPLISCVSVLTPSLITATYSFSRSAISSQIRVAFPRHIGRTPSASGSRVPVCPIFLILMIPRSLATASLDV